MHSNQCSSTKEYAVHFEMTTDASFEELVANYEAAVPPIAVAEIDRFVASDSSWSDVVAEAEADAPLGFFIFWRMNVTASMALNGNTTKCVAYLMGNHVQAERIFRNNPRGFYYVPFRVEIFQAAGGKATLSVAQPSSLLANISDGAIDVVARHLDTKLAGLLKTLDLAVPAELEGLAED